MSDLQKFTVVTSSGARGYVLRRARFLDRSDQNKVVLDDGSELVVPSDALEVQGDGSFLLRDHTAETVVPLEMEQQFDAPPASRMNGADARPSAVQAPTEAAYSEESTRHETTNPAREMRKTVSEDNDVRFDEQLFADEVAIERVPVNRIVDEAPQTRQEGDVLVIPVLEEVVTVQKRLLLKEEVRVHRKRNEVTQPRRVVLHGSETRILGSDGRVIEP